MASTSQTGDDSHEEGHILHVDGTLVARVPVGVSVLAGDVVGVNSVCEVDRGKPGQGAGGEGHTSEAWQNNPSARRKHRCPENVSSVVKVSKCSY